jgi:hypothetical protein
MIRDNYNVGDISPRQKQSIAKIAREAKSRTGKTVAFGDQRFFSKLAGNFNKLAKYNWCKIYLISIVKYQRVRMN